MHIPLNAQIFIGKNHHNINTKDSNFVLSAFLSTICVFLLFKFSLFYGEDKNCIKGFFRFITDPIDYSSAYPNPIMIPKNTDYNKKLVNETWINQFHEKQKKLKKFPQIGDPKAAKIDKIDFATYSELTYYLEIPEVGIPLVHFDLYPNGTVQCNLKTFFRENVNFYHLKNAFVSVVYQRIVTKDNQYFFILYRTHFKQKFFKSDVKWGYRYAVFCAIQFPRTFGHWVRDALGGIISMPKEVWDLNPVLISGTPKSIIQEDLKVLGLDHLEIINTGKNFVYAENLFICKGYEDFHGFGIRTFNLTRTKYREYYKLNNIKPTKHVFINKKGRRHFINLPEVVEMVNSTSCYEWTLIDPNPSERLNFARMFASILIGVMSGGSLVNNVLFMEEKTGVVPLFANFIDYPNIRICYISNVWCLGVLHEHMKHFGQPGMAKAGAIIKAIEIISYAVSNQRWPDDHCMFLSLNYTLMLPEFKKPNHDVGIKVILRDLINNYNNQVPPSRQV